MSSEPPKSRIVPANNKVRTYSALASVCIILAMLSIVGMEMELERSTRMFDVYLFFGIFTTLVSLLFAIKSLQYLYKK